MPFLHFAFLDAEEQVDRVHVSTFSCDLVGRAREHPHVRASAASHLMPASIWSPCVGSNGTPPKVAPETGWNEVAVWMYGDRPLSNT
jgi:hypothetical protein